jgi:hypothetical protein
MRTPRSAPAGAPLIGNVAALVAQGPAASGRGRSRVVREVPDARFVMCEGELRGPLERQIRDLGLDRHVHLVGFRTDVIGRNRSTCVKFGTEGLGSSCSTPWPAAAVVATRAGSIPGDRRWGPRAAGAAA